MCFSSLFQWLGLVKYFGNKWLCYCRCAQGVAGYVNVPGNPTDERERGRFVCLVLTILIRVHCAGVGVNGPWWMNTFQKKFKERLLDHQLHQVSKYKKQDLYVLSLILCLIFYMYCKIICYVIRITYIKYFEFECFHYVYVHCHFWYFLPSRCRN